MSLPILFLYGVYMKSIFMFDFYFDMNNIMLVILNLSCKPIRPFIVN